MKSHPERSDALSLSGVISIAVTSGLLAGAGEVAIALARRFGGNRLWLFGAELVWVTPLAEAVLFGALGAAYAVLSLPIRILRRPVVVVTVFVGLAALVALSQLDGLHLAASALLGLGVGSVLARQFARPGAAVGRTAARIAVGGVVVIGTIAATQVVAERQAETASLARAPAGSGDHPNILFLVLDTVRAWNLGWYGYDRATTPLLDQRFANGVIFDRALTTSPWTLPSHSSMFTGRLPVELSAGWDRPLDRRFPTVAEILSGAGYATGGFVANYRYVGSSTGLDRGFGRYEDYPIDVAEAARMTGLIRRLLRVPRVQEWLGKNRIVEAKTAAAVNRDFLRWVDQHPDRPFLGFINYVDGHSPYLPPPPYDSLFVKSDSLRVARRYVAEVERVFGRGPIPGELVTEYLDGYDGALRYLDVQIDSLLGALEARGRLDNTIVILTSDHGEHFGEHGLIQHGNSLFLPLLHVPLVIWGPKRIPALRVGAPTSLRHLAATIVDLAGVSRSETPGRSLAALWGSDSLAVPPDTLVGAVDWHPTLSKFPPSPLLGGSLRSLLIDSLHYIRRSDGREELYHLGSDFLESRNLAGSPRYRAALVGARATLDAALKSPSQAR